MRYWRTASPEFSARLEEVSKLFLACRDAFHETADSSHWTPALGSPAAEDAQALPSPDPLIPDPRGETGHRLLAEVVQTFLLTASGHLGGLAALYASGEVLFSAPVLIRSVLENCAHAVWVLGEDVEAEDRLARCYLEEFKSAEQARINAKDIYGDQHPAYVAADEASTRLKMQIRSRFVGASVTRLKNDQLVGQELPGLKESVKLMYSLTEGLGGTITQEQASGIYGFLSNMTHPTLYPAQQRRIWQSDAEHGHSVAKLHISMGSVENEARAALAAFYNALSYTTSYFGWPATILDKLEGRVRETIPNFFR